jgi:pimeloyl-ACP methyl ester carboxylesterase
LLHDEGMPMQVDLAGSAGPEVLFIQGVGIHGAGWKPQTDRFSATHRCAWFDNRGMGRNAGMLLPEPLTVDQMAADGFAVLDAAGWLAPVHLVGHSLGGLIALTMALRAPQRVRSLSLLCTFGDGRSVAPLSWRMMWSGLRSRIGSRASRRRGFLELVLPPPPPDSETSSRLARELELLFGHDLADQPPVVSRQLAAMRRTNVLSRLPELGSIPALVMSAAHDPIAPPALGKALAEGIRGARYAEVPDASHGLPITHADLVNRELERHFSGQQEC